MKTLRWTLIAASVLCLTALHVACSSGSRAGDGAPSPQGGATAAGNGGAAGSETDASSAGGGASGDTGIAGAAGISGDAGAAGVSGSAGAAGVSGQAGAGTSGNAGAAGASGQAGAGASDSAGSAGAGAGGNAGSAGTAGAAGASGSAGAGGAAQCASTCVWNDKCCPSQCSTAQDGDCGYIDIDIWYDGFSTVHVQPATLSAGVDSGVMLRWHNIGQDELQIVRFGNSSWAQLDVLSPGEVTVAGSVAEGPWCTYGFAGSYNVGGLAYDTYTGSLILSCNL